MLFESPGVWWLPRRPERRVAGVFRVRDDGHVEVQLFEALLDDRLAASAEFDQLHGTIHRSPFPGGTEISHLRGFAIQRAFTSSGGATETLVANRTYLGDRHVQPTDRFDVFTAELHGLADWLRGSTIARTIAGAESSFSLGPPLEVAAAVAGCTVRLTKKAHVEASAQRVVLSESAVACLQIDEPTSVDALVENWLVPLRILLSLAIGRVAYVQRLSIVLEPETTWPDEVHDVELWAAAHVRARSETRDPEPWIPPPRSSEELTALLQRWWGMRTGQRRAIERIFSLWDRPPEYVDTRFIAYSSAIDLLARVLHGAPDAAAKVFESLPCGAPDALRGVRLFDRWRAARARLEDEGYVEGPKLLALCGGLAWVARLTLLAELGVPLDGVLRSGELRHDVHRLERAFQ